MKIKRNLPIFLCTISYANGAKKQNYKENFLI